MRLNLVTAPAIEPVSTDEAKAFLRITGSTEDTFIDSLIVVARTAAENYTRRAFIEQTYQLYMDTWPEGKGEQWWDGVKQLPISHLHGVRSFEMPKAPLSSITHIKTYDDADTATAFSSSNYYVSAYSGDFAEPGRVTLRDGQSWPTFERNADGIEIQFVAGYGDTMASVPQQIRQGILQEVAYLYEHRMDCEDGLNCSVARKILEPFRIMKL